MEALLDFFFPIKTKNANSNYYTYFVLGFSLRKKNSALSQFQYNGPRNYPYFVPWGGKDRGG